MQPLIASSGTGGSNTSAAQSGLHSLSDNRHYCLSRQHARATTVLFCGPAPYAQLSAASKNGRQSTTVVMRSPKFKEA